MDVGSNGTINDDELTEFDHDTCERRQAVSVPELEQDGSPIEEQLGSTGE